jgi:hypothetical protein
VNTVAGASVKFQFPESMTFDPMSIHVHPAPYVAPRDSVATDDRAPMAAVSVCTRRAIALADMSETARRRTVLDLTLSDRRGRFSSWMLELSRWGAFDGGGGPSQ